jgi:hypothetical protein
MLESPTGTETEIQPASNEPTGNEPANQPAESQNQETTSNEQSQEAVSDDESAKQTENKNTESGAVTDDGLAKFAKSQGIEDLSELTEREQKFLKVAHDNQKAARSNTGPKVTDAVEGLDTLPDDATEVQRLSSKFAQLEYEKQTDKFWADGRDRSLEPTMVQILQDKVKELTPSLGEAGAKSYVKTLSRDLDTLYGMASLRSGAADPDAAKEEGRREAITSIKKASNAAPAPAHAVSSSPSTPKIDADWIANTYDPSNKEHVALVDSLARSDLY